MKTNNRGFTLTELLVCTVIFGVVLIAAFGFMLASAKSYNKVNDRLEIQNQSQMALNLIEEYVIDSAGGIFFDTKNDDSFEVNTLYILEAPTTTISQGAEVTTCDVDVFRLSAEDNVLKYARASAELQSVDEETGIAIYQLTLPGETGFYEVTKDALVFNAITENDGSGLYTISAKITLGLKNRSAEYEGAINVALRNRPAVITIS